ncbi:gustatory receptor for sugar taste 43a [Leptinotarsa decemlineata]|uniref:gustatory receptor for sugar taste 43a n=1 Tax=Leptinotarsa decemlineata TaxID=7539 RepID=UPI003D305F61
MKEVIIFHIVYLIKIRISLLNDELEELGKILIKNNRTFSEKGIMLNIGSISLTKMGGNTKQFRKQDIKIQKASDIVNKIMEMAKFHDKILEAVEIVNNSIEFGIHIIMLSCLLHLIVTSYFLLIDIFLRGSPVVIIQQLIWIQVHVGRILLIVEPCQSCVNEHKKTKIKVCELLTYDMNEEVKNSMEYFSLQLMYCEMDFSCCGFFEINRSLLTSIAGAVFTYLVILFQFED